MNLDKMFNSVIRKMDEEAVASNSAVQQTASNNKNQPTQQPAQQQPAQQQPAQQQPAQQQPAQQQPAQQQPAQQQPAQQQPAQTQRQVNSIVVSAPNDIDLSPGVKLPKGSQAIVTPGDLSGNVQISIGDKTYKVPDANLKNLIKQGGVTVDNVTESFLHKTRITGF